ncbi:MAG TPA: hypothetical protein PLW02_09780 [Verrucomicrobiota bacterium]|nr:hypothetical protein [Verrucomicrobiota bacterium]
MVETSLLSFRKWWEHPCSQYKTVSKDIDTTFRTTGRNACATFGQISKDADTKLRTQ